MSPVDSGNSTDTGSSVDGTSSVDDGSSTDDGTLADDRNVTDDENTAGDGGSDDTSVSDDASTGDGAAEDATDGAADDDTSVGDGAARDANVSDGAVHDANISDGPTDDANVSDAGSTGLTSPVNLGTAGKYVILTKTGISTVPPSVITGNLGVSPITATAITGFSLTADATNVFSRSTQVTGKVYAANYAAPTPSNLTTAIGDMQHAFTDAAGRAPGVTELGAGNIGGMTLTRGVYKWGTGVLIPTDLTLTGSATDVWIFQIAQTLKVSSATNIVLTGGAVPKNVFWEVSGAVDLGTTSHFEGVILTQTMIALKTGASIHGRLFAQTNVSLEKNTVVEPAP